MNTANKKMALAEQENPMKNPPYPMLTPQLEALQWQFEPFPGRTPEEKAETEKQATDVKSLGWYHRTGLSIFIFMVVFAVAKMCGYKDDFNDISSILGTILVITAIFGVEATVFRLLGTQSWFDKAMSSTPKKRSK